MRKLLLDSAQHDEVELFMRSRAVAGVTTNPTLISKIKNVPVVDLDSDGFTRYLRVLEFLYNDIEKTCLPTRKRHLSVEVITLGDKMYDQALRIQNIRRGRDDISPDLHVKIPVMPHTLEVIERLAEKGVKVNATACMTRTQAIMACDAGAKVVSFFYNRMVDGIKKEIPDVIDNDARRLALDEIGQYKSLRPRGAAVICGSIRQPRDISECWLAGADYVTASAKVLREVLEHPKTTEAIVQFQADIDKWLS